MIPSRPIVLKNATVLDGKGSPARKADIRLAGGRIANLETDSAPIDGATEVPLDGCYVSPGWIDLHTHVFGSYGVFSVPPGDIGLTTGVTTLVDAGSAGALNYRLFSESVIRSAREDVLAYVNIASAGLPHGHAGRPGFVGDHYHPSLHSVDLAADLLDHYPESIVGWKARLTDVLANHDVTLERNAWLRLLELRERTSKPVMVHHIRSNISTEALVSSLDRADVYTHLYHGIESCLFDRETGRPLDAASEARERGVIFDVGHGSGAFRWSCAERACQEFNFWPDTISSDLHSYNQFWPVRDLATTMSKFLHLGASLENVIAMVTGNTRAALNREIGVLDSSSVGQAADLTIFTIQSGQYSWADADGIVRVGKKRIVPIATIKKGQVVPCYGFYARENTSDSLTIALQGICGY